MIYRIDDPSELHSFNPDILLALFVAVCIGLAVAYFIRRGL